MALIARGMIIDNGCRVCGNYIESLTHSFFGCEWSSQLWSWVLPDLDVQNFVGDDFMGVLQHVLTPLDDEQVQLFAQGFQRVGVFWWFDELQRVGEDQTAAVASRMQHPTGAWCPPPVAVAKIYSDASILATRNSLKVWCGHS
ncbi:hypothetical protein SLEP1_g21532 [Rubroshorea leprosula]|uniref:Reverse transcriptase zinc-binding domain-containing protein n=1 Tax=Rubroshorea leprosula TaxID=152421 RepID=A0AAV5J9C9_9ROSI|nr:hypothetical protein SLEP1_g21532 [Rubroshorea leprosula]